MSVVQLYHVHAWVWTAGWMSLRLCNCCPACPNCDGSAKQTWQNMTYYLLELVKRLWCNPQHTVTWTRESQGHCTDFFGDTLHLCTVSSVCPVEWIFLFLFACPAFTSHTLETTPVYRFDWSFFFCDLSLFLTRVIIDLSQSQVKSFFGRDSSQIKSFWVRDPSQVILESQAIWAKSSKYVTRLDSTRFRVRYLICYNIEALLALETNSFKFQPSVLKL